jgi:hypothetical protein
VSESVCRDHGQTNKIDAAIMTSADVTEIKTQRDALILHDHRAGWQF